MDILSFTFIVLVIVVVGSAWFASVPTGGQFNRCARGKKLQLMMLVSICRRVLIALTRMVMVTGVDITVAMPPGTTLATSTWATTEGSTEVAGIIESGFSRDQACRS
jgi:hypothetical protein